MSRALLDGDLVVQLGVLADLRRPPRARDRTSSARRWTARRSRLPACSDSAVCGPRAEYEPAALQMTASGQLQPKLRDIVAAGGLVPEWDHPAAGHPLHVARASSRWRSRSRSWSPSWPRSVPRVRDARTASSIEDTTGAAARPEPARGRPLSPAEHLEHSRLLGGAIALMGLAYLALTLARATDRLAALNVRHDQLRLPHPGGGATRHAGAPDAGRPRRGACDLGGGPAVSVLRRDRGDHHVHGPERAHRPPVRRRVDAHHVPRRWSRRTRRYSGSSCHPAARSG